MDLKNTRVYYAGLVKINFNPKEDKVVSTDASYTSVKVKQNNVYLSVAISHKTKVVESWYLSNKNNNQLVINAFNQLKRTKEFIVHFDTLLNVHLICKKSIQN